MHFRLHDFVALEVKTQILLWLFELAGTRIYKVEVADIGNDEEVLFSGKVQSDNLCCGHEASVKFRDSNGEQALSERVKKEDYACNLLHFCYELLGCVHHTRYRASVSSHRYSEAFQVRLVLHELFALLAQSTFT